MSQPAPDLSTQDYPAGHVGHLSAEQTSALQEFRSMCIDAGYLTSPTDSSADPSRSDETLLRFLRARKFQPRDAFTQFKDAEDWRKDQDLGQLYETLDVDEYEQTRRLYTQWTGRRDKMGIPLYILRIADLDLRTVSALNASSGKPQQPGALPQNLRRLFATIEHLYEFVTPLCSAVPGRPFVETPISQTTNIVDVSGVGIRQFWALRQHLQEASVMATAYYPELLGRVFIIGAPSFFSTVWGWIKGWFDPGTVSKIFILSQAEVAPTLEKFLAKPDIPKRYGGTLEWDFGQLPCLDHELTDLLNLKDKATIPIGPLRWVASGTMMDAHAVGSVKGIQRDEVFASMPRI